MIAKLRRKAAGEEETATERLPAELLSYVRSWAGKRVSLTVGIFGGYCTHTLSLSLSLSLSFSHR